MLKVNKRIPFGNACDVDVLNQGETPEVRFAADPRGGAEALWFCFALVHQDGKDKKGGIRPGRVRLTLKYCDTLRGGIDPSKMRPVYRPEGQNWFRMNGGSLEARPDGHYSAVWTIPYPESRTEVAFCFPYGGEQLDTLLAKCKGYWKRDDIGVTQAGYPVRRLANDYGQEGGRHPGLYLVARQHAGETPGSWVLDGMLDRLSRAKKSPFITWSVPLADGDGVALGVFGKDQFPIDLNRAWGIPPRRHETLVIQRDMALWRARCKPALVLDLHSPGACDQSGVFSFAPSPDNASPIEKESIAWAHVLQNQLRDLAATDFCRVADYPMRWSSPHAAQYVRDTLGVPALALEIPYAVCNGTLMTQKQYREVGHRLADAILRR